MVVVFGKKRIELKGIEEGVGSKWEKEVEALAGSV